MTQTMFDTLPGLMPAKVFMQVTGLSRDKLRTMRKSGFIVAIQQPGARKFLYRKTDGAALTGFKLN